MGQKNLPVLKIGLDLTLGPLYDSKHRTAGPALFRVFGRKVLTMGFLHNKYFLALLVAVAAMVIEKKFGVVARIPGLNKIA